jgi:hypothetical protein
MMIYSLGRGIGPADRRPITEMERNWAAQGYRFQSLIYEVARSAPFRSRRGETLETGKPPAKEVASK